MKRILLPLAKTTLKYIKLIPILFCVTLANNSCNNEVNNIVPLSQSWEKAIPNQNIPEGLVSLKSKDCGTCHKTHYEEWKHSTHAHAWTDQQFQAELKKESSPFMCINCHIPLQNQQEYIIEGLIDGDIYKPIKKKNPHFNQSLQEEGINCASCHVRNNAIIGPTSTKKAPHKTIKDTAFLSEQLCISCHNANAVITPTLACSFETGDEWKTGPYYGEKNCKSCHMETITREIVKGYGKRSSHSHFFPGSGIPKIIGTKTKGLNGMGIYPSKLKHYFSLSDSINFSLKLVNEFAGHNLPTGDPERFFIISIIIKNGLDSTLFKKTERIGEHWEWYPEAKKITDNNLKPKEERIYKITYIPKEKGLIKLIVSVTKHRLNKSNADYNKLTDDYPLFISVFNKEYTINIE